MNEELKKAAEEYATEWHENPDGSAWKQLFEESAIKAFLAGAEWRDAQIPKLPDDVDEAAKQFVGYDMDTDELRDYEIGVSSFKAGAEWMKEQMMEEAVECELYYDGDFLAIDLNMAELGYSERDKVRVIILKEEEQ